MNLALRRFLFIFFIFSVSAAFAQDDHEKNTHEKKDFDAGPFIMHHVMDSYEWHIATFGDVEVAVPLPVIVKSKRNGNWYVFLSYKLHNHEGYKGFRIAHEGEFEGKIVETLDDGTVVRPLDLSFTKNAFAIFFSLALMLWLFLGIAKSYKKYPDKPPRGIQSALEPLIIFIRDDIAKASIGEKKYEKYVPFLLTVFFFIFLNNLLGLVPIFPGGANVTGNITVTLVLASFTFVITTFSGNKHYWKHIFWPPGVPVWLKIPPILPFVEFLGIFIKPFVLMVRLFANILAGHIIALSFYALIFIFAGMGIAAAYGISIMSIAFTVFMSLLELLVAFIQAYVFTLLSAIYFGMATEEEH